MFNNYLINIFFIAHLALVKSFILQDGNKRALMNGEQRRKQGNIVSLQSSKFNLENHDVLIDEKYTIEKTGHALAPPHILQTLALHERIQPFESVPDLSITKISNDPNVFLFKNFLTTRTTYDINSLIEQATEQGMEYSGTSAGDVVKQRIGSYTSWIHSDQEDARKSLAQYVSRHMIKLSSAIFIPNDLKKPPSEADEEWRFDAEPLQIVRYEPGGKYDMHHDGLNRLLTVLTYCNGVAGTWFPYALFEDASEKSSSLDSDEIPDMRSGNVAQDKTPGEDGLLLIGVNDKNHVPSKNVVRVKPGDAIVFYNYDWIVNHCPDSENGTPPTGPIINWRSIHSGETAAEEKWIATNWFNFNL